MMRIIYPIMGTLVIGLAILLAASDAGRLPGRQAEFEQSPTAGTMLASYRPANDLFPGDPDRQFDLMADDARRRALDDLDYARDQLSRARAEVERLLSEIAIEGAEDVEIGGEVRAARMVEAEWRRAAAAVTAYIARLDFEIAESVPAQR